MSLLWRDRIQVFFAPGRVDMVRTFRGIKSRQSPRISEVYGAPQDAAMWKKSLQQLEQMIEKENIASDLKGAELIITLSNHFVRYVVVSPQQEITGPSELFAYANFRMREVYGERVDGWVVSISDEDPYQGTLCAAISRDLYNEFEALASRHRIKLKRIEPYLTAAFDQWCNSFNDKRFWFVVIERERLCMTLFSNSEWKGIRNQRVVHSIETELIAALEQEAINSGYREPIEQVYLLSPEHPDLSLPTDKGWQFAYLPTEKIPVPLHFPSVSVADSEAGYA
ncbi:hypothetical protein [Nitrosomonas communis]|uniref:Uncharacterized protein n=1 Tax=Nitrosomonas communis TaxID=44574 RepID=A0A1I4J0T2_9PROT|nr:hypothetical protein [Nitrosomonas communis]SFL60185.1 hypothetical protein SAMN05421863_1001141 [Nitrosomonas communis]